MNKEITNSQEPPYEGILRRQFLGLTGALGAGLVFRRLLPVESKGGLFDPEIVSGIDVYGLDGQIKTQEDIDALYEHFNSLFDKKLLKDMALASQWEQRDYLLDPNERYLEIVLKQSAYQKFSESKPENGSDLVGLMKMHVDLLNRVMENARPSSSLQVKLLRVVVVGDSFSSNPSRYSKDLDGSWFIDEGYFDCYHADHKRDTIPGYFWSFYTDQVGNLILRGPSGWGEIIETYSYPPKDDSLTGKRGIWLDCGVMHEWSHLLLSLPDEYIYDVSTGPFRFKTFILDTGSFHKPWLSPYLSYLLKRNVEKGVRGYYTHPEGPVVITSGENDPVGLKPSRNEITITSQGRKLDGHGSIYKVRLEGDYYSQKSFSLIPDQEAEGNTIALDNHLFETKRDGDKVIYPTNWILRVQDENTERELHIPAVSFNMSRIAGKEEAKYTIEFTGNDNLVSIAQILQLVDESDIERYLEEHRKKNDFPYAIMKIDGTSTYCVWLLR